jgi:hypothetical protein
LPDHDSSAQQSGLGGVFYKNTVVYWVTKAEGILGHGLLERRPELEAPFACTHLASTTRRRDHISRTKVE